MLNGAINFLLSGDERTRLLLDQFVFVVIPMLNPDGVVRGHARMDTQGNDLNRFYHRAS